MPRGARHAAQLGLVAAVAVGSWLVSPNVIAAMSGTSSPTSILECRANDPSAQMSFAYAEELLKSSAAPTGDHSTARRAVLAIARASLPDQMTFDRNGGDATQRGARFLGTLHHRVEAELSVIRLGRSFIVEDVSACSSALRNR